MEHQHNPTNGSSTKNHHPINEASTSPYQWGIIILSCNNIILLVDHHIYINKASSSTSYQVVIYYVKIDGDWRQNIYKKDHVSNMHELRNKYHRVIHRITIALLSSYPPRYSWIIIESSTSLKLDNH
ncbi:hypothetical protein KY285_027325 [Solanum tuberosum]|nr:hypothetical protein KY285_027325 [Solanum tuberosum]